MNIFSIQKTTLIDYPWKIACTIFTYGCNFRCGFCHNPELIELSNIDQYRDNFIQEDSFLEFLKQRKNKLEGVCITGGEPTLQPDLVDFITKIKKLDYAVKLDTNGSNPQMLKELIDKKLLDYVSMDIKSSPEQYSDLAGINLDINKIIQSKDLLLNSQLDFEFRTTVIAEKHNPAIIEKIGQWIQGAPKFCLQNFRPQITYQKNYQQYRWLTKIELLECQSILQKYVQKCEIRDS